MTRTPMAQGLTETRYRVPMDRYEPIPITPKNKSHFVVDDVSKTADKQTKMKRNPCKRCNGTGLEPDQSETGKRMRILRESKNLSLRSVAEFLNLSAAYVSDLELGRRAWSADRIREVKNAISKLQ